MTEEKKETPLKKVMIIVAKGSMEDIYAGLVMANGAVMEGIECKMFFTFFGLDAIIKKRQNKCKTATVGNISGASDTAIQTNVDAVIDYFADGNAVL